jgi:serine/threonine protein kinase/tetratricopeptide (TPR) repeat protein
MSLEPGDRLGPYEIHSLLGVGGMGEVYRGRDRRLGRDVALKVITPSRVEDSSVRRRFEIEARAASVLNHPSIVTIYDVGETDGVSWIAMEWVEGRTLREAISEGPLPLRETLQIASQIADGLAAAHAKGIVHRDLKPENVMLIPGGRSKILDFGLARQTVGEMLGTPSPQADTIAAPPSSATREGTILGTVGYMSPEQASGRLADFHSDQFALGLLVYEMLTGRRAFARATAVETLSAIIREEPAPLAGLRDGIPPELLRVIGVCLAKNPENRFPSTQELAAALDALRAGVSIGSSVPTIPLAPPAEVARPSPSQRRLYIGAVAVALALAAGWLLFHFRVSRNPIDSLAVLPFENTSRDPDAEYLSDGLTESLITQMSSIPSLKVMARATVFRFKGTTDPQDTGRKLGVGAVLTGTVSRRADRLSVSAELMEIATGVRLWGEKYDRPATDLLRIQDSIASDIADRLRPQLSGPVKRILSRHGTENPEVYELALKARYHLLKESEEDDLEARRLYQQAIERDPKFVDARVGFATTFSRAAVSGWVLPTEAWPRAQQELQTAVALDPENVLVRCALATRHFFYDWEWAKAEREYRALGPDPRLLTGELWRPIALFHWARGRTDEAVALIEQALRVDPGNLNSRLMMADFLAHAGRLEDALRRYRDIVDTEPSDPFPRFGLAEVLRRRGDAKGAIDALRKAYELAGEEAGAKALDAAQTEHDYENAEVMVARSRLGELQALAKERYVSPLELARRFAQVGDRGKALDRVEAALAERSPGLVFLKVDRAWDRIRDDARFASVVRQVGIP